MLSFLVPLLVLSVTFVPLERMFALRRQQRVLRPGWRTDILHFFVNPLIEVGATIVVLAPVVVLGIVVVPDQLQELVATQPDWLEAFEAFAIVVVGTYWGHRFAHQVPFLWRFHRVHHSSPQLDWMAAVHLHPFDQAFTRFLPVIPLVALGFSGATLGGVVVVLQLLAILEHANVRWSFGPLRWVLPNPQWHHWHHSAEAHDSNYSGIPFVDAIFGTAHFPSTSGRRATASTNRCRGATSASSPHPSGRRRRARRPTPA